MKKLSLIQLCVVVTEQMEGYCTMGCADSCTPYCTVVRFDGDLQKTQWTTARNFNNRWQPYQTSEQYYDYKINKQMDLKKCITHINKSRDGYNI